MHGQRPRGRSSRLGVIILVFLVLFLLIHTSTFQWGGAQGLRPHPPRSFEFAPRRIKPESPPAGELQPAESHPTTDISPPEHEESNEDIQPPIAAEPPQPAGPKGYAEAHRLAVNGTIMIIPTNKGWLDYGYNLWCSLKKVMGTPRGVIFLAFDSGAYDELKRKNLPVYMDPQIEEQGKEQFGFDSPKFNRLVCNKLTGVLHLLQRGLDVVLIDGDIIFKQDPVKYFPPAEYDITWSWGGNLNPLAKWKPGMTKLPPPSCLNGVVIPGRCYPNTGYYYARPTKAAIGFMRRASEDCLAGKPTNFGNHDDQSYVAQRLEEEETAKQADYRLACFNPCMFANGNTFFLFHAERNTTFIRTGEKHVLVHCNFLKKEGKRDRLRQAGLWDTSCVAN